VRKHGLSRESHFQQPFSIRPLTIRLIGILVEPRPYVVSGGVSRRRRPPHRSIPTFEEASGASSLRTFRTLVSMPVSTRRVRITRSMRARGTGFIHVDSCGRRGGIYGFKVGLYPHHPSIVTNVSFTAL
jgi:hypothetical protein